MRGPVINAAEYQRVNGLLQETIELLREAEGGLDLLREAVELIREAEGELENFNPTLAQKLADWLRTKAQGY